MWQQTAHDAQVVYLKIRRPILDLHTARLDVMEDAYVA